MPMLTKRLFPLAGRRGALAPFETFREEMDRLFNDWLTEMDEPPVHLEAGRNWFTPRVDVVETDKELRVTAELPGMVEKEVEVELTPRLLTLKGERKTSTEQKGETWYRRELRHGAFAREIPLPWEVDADKVTANATLHNGVLTVTVPKPKTAPANRRQIPVKTQ